MGDGSGNFAPVWPDQTGISVSGDATSLTTTDFNNDGAPDLFIGVNAAEQITFDHAGGTADNTLCLRLPSNTPPGTQVTLTMKDGSTLPDQTAEIHAGGGYLSQSARLVFFGTGRNGTKAVKEISIQFPNRKTLSKTLSQLDKSGRTFRIHGAVP